MVICFKGNHSVFYKALFLSGVILSFGGYSETFLLVTTGVGGFLVISNGSMPRILLNILQFTGQSSVFIMNSVQSLVVSDSATPWTAAPQASLSITNSGSLLKLVHWVSDTIQPSHPLSFPSPAFNLSQHQGLFQWVSSLHQVARVLEFQLQHPSFQWIFRTDFL